MSRNLKDVKKPVTIVGSYSETINNGMTMDELQKTLETLDLEDGNALREQAECCGHCCSGNTVVIKMPTPEKAVPGEKVQDVTFEFTLPE